MTKEMLEIIDNIVAAQGRTVDRVIPILQAIQTVFNYLPEDALARVCETTDISPSQICSVSTFYSQFRHEQVGNHIIHVCVGTACHVKGALLVYDAFRRELKLNDETDTDVDKLFTLNKVACLGCCTIAPVVQIDDITYGNVSSERIPEILADFLQQKNNPGEVSSLGKPANSIVKGEIRIGLGSCCVASGSAGVKEALEKTLNRNNINVNVKQVGCVGICNQVPMMEIQKEGEPPVIYTHIRPEEVRKIIGKHFKPDSFIDELRNRFYNFVENLAIEDVPVATQTFSPEKRDNPVTSFLNGQINIATEHRGEIKPLDYDEYERLGGFSALHKCLFESTPDDVINEVKKSGLRGRGGAGFPTGQKWELVKNVVSDTKYIICNGDEGDPGAFMDRMLLESYPFRIIEGMIIAAYAIGATQGYFYIRAEYKLAVKQISTALEICRKKNLLGKTVLGSSFSFDIFLFEGAGAFVCGEETALIASVEGKRGFPSLRPPYPSESGLWDKPTLINNTETFSMVSWIFRNGADAFNKSGTEKSKGTKVFALAGKIKRGGLIEVPMGTIIRQIVEDIGGGIAGGKLFKAVQIGGPSGGCIPASMADLPIDYESLTSAGAMMGSGGLVVLDETDCMVDIARYFLSFTQDQSCGKCTFCRIGTRKMLEILDRICSGQGKVGDIEALEQLAVKTHQGSLCGLGKSAPNPVLSTLKYYREEYEAHIQGKCPTGKCKEMIRYEIKDDCIGCTKCAQRCPSDAIEARPHELHVIDQEKCIKCDVCKQICPTGSVITI
ncbi:MAG: proton-conducting membrane transporter [Bacteroidetes bacterium HGW-Bacteroidetes-21]|nr:MAG: proton-conducting membrane transporter [Bacteroidetes bacterium HGW-Bacteroidetes-21]